MNALVVFTFTCGKVMDAVGRVLQLDDVGEGQVT
jgi:hypothetical protein